MLEGIFKGLALWLYGLILSGVEYISNALLDVFQMDMTYFETAVPVSKDIFAIIVAVGWALLIGNLTFQSMKTMLSGIGFEGEDPKILFCRSFVFGFLLLASRQICEIGMSISNSVIDLLQVPTSVAIPSIDENSFTFDGSWILVIIVGVVMMFQIVKFFFQMGERYVIMAVLTILAPLAFGVGGSKNTEDIFKGFIRMYASMCVMMVMNVVFLKILLSVMGTVPSGPAVLPWLILIVAIGRVARKIDDIISRIGMNSARTGDPLGKGNLPGMLTMMVAKQIASAGISRSGFAKTTNTSRGTSGSTGKGGKQKPASAPHSSSKSGANSSQQTVSHSNNFSRAGNHFNQNSSQNTSQSTSQSAAQNVNNATNSQANNSAQMAASIAGNAAGSTMAGVQAGKVSSANPTRPPSRNSSVKSRQSTNHQQTTRQEKAAPTSAGTASAGTITPSRPSLGNVNNSNTVPRQETTIISQSNSSQNIPSEARFAPSGSLVGRKGAAVQTTVNNSSSETSQNVPSSLGRNTGAAQTSQANSSYRPSQNVPLNPGRNSLDRNNPEIYSRSSAADVAPLQNSSLKNKNTNTKEPAKTAHRPPIGNTRLDSKKPSGARNTNGGSPGRDKK